MVLVGIPFALTGHEVWALVYAWLTQIVVNLAIVYSRSRHRVGFGVGTTVIPVKWPVTGLSCW